LRRLWANDTCSAWESIYLLLPRIASCGLETRTYLLHACHCA
jgi:hypothetical protein